MNMRWQDSKGMNVFRQGIIFAFISLVAVATFMHRDMMRPSLTVMAAQGAQRQSAYALQVPNRQLTYRRIELTGSGLIKRERGSAIIESMTQDRRTIELFVVEGANLPPSQDFTLYVNGQPLARSAQGVVRTDEQGRFRVEFVRGQHAGPGQRRLPYLAPPVTEFDTIELVTAEGETVLGGSYELARESLLTSHTIRILNATGQVVLEGTFVPTTQDERVTLQAQLTAQADPDATGTATIEFTELSAGGFDQDFELSIDDLDVDPPFTLEVNGGAVALFTTNFSGRADIAYEGRFETQAGPIEAETAIADAEFRILQAQREIRRAEDFGADVTRPQLLLDQAQSQLDDAQAALQGGEFDTSIDAALSAERTAREASLSAMDAADQAEEQNPNGNGNANDNDNGNGNDNGNTNDNDNGNDNGNMNDNDNGNGNDNGNMNDNDNGNVNDNGNANDNDNGNGNDNGNTNDNGNGNDNGNMNDNDNGNMNDNDNGNHNGNANDNENENDDDHGHDGGDDH